MSKDLGSKINCEEFYRPYLQNMKRVGADKIQGHDDTHPSFWFNINNGCFKCEAYGETGNGMTFLEKKEGIDRKEAYNRLKKLGGEGKYTLEEYFEQKHLPLDSLKSLGGKVPATVEWRKSSEFSSRPWLALFWLK